MSKPSELGALKIGSYILLPVSGPNEEPCKIVEYDTSKPGKHGAAKARIVGVGIFDKKKYSHVSPVSAQVQVPLIDKRVGSIISKTPTSVQIMDAESFEVFDAQQIEDEIKERVLQGVDVEYWKVMDRTIIVRIKS
ncbi:MAG TPA: translation initiation factor IF-5A [Candidatus Nitrosotalea sp.]|nr:translation initiation factor IF-5A [Candidatus Nitrosotalea sp.]